MQNNSTIFTQNGLVQVLLASNLPRTLTYRLGEGQNAAMGSLVEAPLGNKKAFGIIVGAAETPPDPSKIKELVAVLDHPPLKPALRDFVFWVGDYCMEWPGNILAMVFGGQSIRPPKKPRAEKPSPPPRAPQKPVLSDAQMNAARELSTTRDYFVAFLDGVTGSGKTEVYCEAIDALLQEGKQALVMLPEIALTTQLTERLTRRFGFAPALWHSHLTPAQRRDTWKSIATGKARLVVGARSSLFLPFADLGAIIVDEEHDASYKQEEGTIYHARDMAVVRGKLENVPVILSSATPSVETWVNAKGGKYKHVILPERHGTATLPDIHLIDLRAEKMPKGGWISPSLQEQVRARLDRGEQTLLFLNRRGYAPLTLCRRCGHRFSCPQCTAWLVEHRVNGQQRLSCHHCDYSTSYPPRCPSCQAENSLAPCGPGVERLDEEVARLFPTASRAVLTSDTQNKLGELQELVTGMEEGKISILIGTQLVAKGYHFPKLTLVGVVDGDLGLSGGDLRAAERTFQILTQVAGRSGRADDAGAVFIQTTQPGHAVMQNLLGHDRNHLLETLAHEREMFHMPPFARLATLTLSGTDKNKVQAEAEKLARHIPNVTGIDVLGPAPAPMAMLRGRYRERFLITSGRNVKLQSFIRDWLAATKLPSTIRLAIDIDPYHFM